MIDTKRILFIHGSDSNGQTYKARVLRGIFPELVAPDFSGPLGVRMAKVDAIIGDETNWTLIGSSLGGLMAATFTAKHPDQVRMLVLLAPALNHPEFTKKLPKPVMTPTLLIHGKKDEVVPPEAARRLTKQIFPKMKYLSVDDDHRLHHTAETLDWKSLLE